MIPGRPARTADFYQPISAPSFLVRPMKIVRPPPPDSVGQERHAELWCDLLSTVHGSDRNRAARFVPTTNGDLFLHQLNISPQPHPPHTPKFPTMPGNGRDRNPDRSTTERNFFHGFTVGPLAHTFSPQISLRFKDLEQPSTPSRIPRPELMLNIQDVSTANTERQDR